MSRIAQPVLVTADVLQIPRWLLHWISTQFEMMSVSGYWTSNLSTLGWLEKLWVIGLGKNILFLWSSTLQKFTLPFVNTLLFNCLVLTWLAWAALKPSSYRASTMNTYKIEKTEYHRTFSEKFSYKDWPRIGRGQRKPKMDRCDTY